MNCEEVFRVPKDLGCLGVKKQILTKYLEDRDILLQINQPPPNEARLRNKGLTRP